MFAKSKTTFNSVGLALLSPVWLMCLLFSLSAWGAPTTKLKPLSGPPTSTLHVTGSGFAPHETVFIAFGTTPLASVTADAAGAFTGDIKVPASARPGQRKITATGESSGLSAVEMFTVNTNWLAFNFNAAHSGYNRYENIVNPANVHRLTEKWHVTGYYLNFVEASPIVYNGIVYASSGNGHLYAFNAADGALKWQAATGDSFSEPVSTPAVFRGVVYVATPNGFYAFNADNGQQKWMRPFDMGIITSNAVVANGIVYAGGSNNNLYALSATDGKLLWKKTLDDRADSSTPAVANGFVYIGSWKGTLFAFNALDGSLKWKKVLSEWGLSAPAFADGKIYVSEVAGGGLYALNAADGSLKWKTEWCGWSSPVVAEGVVYVGACAVNAADGHLKWTAPAGGVSPVAIANGVVYAGSWDSTLYALNASDGNLKWKGAVKELILSAPAVANGVVFVTSQAGDLYAFHLAAP